MIEIKIEKSTCDHGATIYTATPAEICLGGLDASQVDEIHVTPPEDWSGCTIRLTVRPNCAPRIARILDDSGIVKVTSDMTIKKSGVIVIDAQNADGYAAYSTDIRYTAYDHQRAGTASGQPSPSEYQQMIAMAAEGVKSVNGVKPDENGNVQVQGGSVSDNQISQAVSDYMTENPVTIPETLPNPNALTFTGAVEGSYNGSEPLEVEIPSGGGIDIETAEVGQIIKVAAVDDNGKPTAWEAVDLQETLVLYDNTLTEDTAYVLIDADMNGNPLNVDLDEYIVWCEVSYSTAYTEARWFRMTQEKDSNWNTTYLWESISGAANYLWTHRCYLMRIGGIRMFWSALSRSDSGYTSKTAPTFVSERNAMYNQYFDGCRVGNCNASYGDYNLLAGTRIRLCAKRG